MDTLSFDIDKLIKICRENDAAMIGVFGSGSQRRGYIGK